MNRVLLKLRPLSGRPMLPLAGRRMYSSVPPSPTNKVQFFTAGAFLAAGASGLGYYLARKQHGAAPENLQSTTPLSSIGAPKYGSSKDFEQGFAEIEQIIGKDAVSRNESALEAVSSSPWSSHQATEDQRPNLIAYPENTEQVSKIIKVCHKYHIPVVPISGGTALEGHFAPTRRGLSLSFERMNKVITVFEDDLEAIVQPDVGWEDLADYLAPKGFMFPPDPGPGARIGGMVGTSCSGTNAFHYGTIKDWILSLTVVLADGTVIKTRRRPLKSSAGYDLTHLFIGAEGTLGIVTEITIKLTSVPQNLSVGVVSFSSVREAVDTVASIVRKGVSPYAMEFLDSATMKSVNESGETSKDWAERPTLFFKFAGPTPTSVSEELAAVREIADKNGAKSFDIARDQETIDELWEARKEALWSVQAAGGVDNHIWTTDVAVPISKLPQLVDETRKDLDNIGLFSGIVGHVGDGNFHAFISFPPDKTDVAAHAVDRLVDRAIEMDGTCTGEHGVGLVKRKHLPHELGPATVDTMRHIKFALDPLCILNPDKVIQTDPNDKTIDDLN